MRLPAHRVGGFGMMCQLTCLLSARSNEGGVARTHCPHIQAASQASMGWLWLKSRC